MDNDKYISVRHNKDILYRTLSGDKLMNNRDEIGSDKEMKMMKEEVLADITSKINILMDKIVSEKLDALVSEKLEALVSEKLNKISMQQSKPQQSPTELAIVDNNRIYDEKMISNEIVLAIGSQIEQSVYASVINKINEELVPKVNNMAEWVNYNMQDGNDLVDQYRRAAEKQTNTDGMGLLTYGKTDKRIISPHVRTFFEDDESSEEYL